MRSSMRGATWADSPADVAAASDVVFAMVGYPAEVQRGGARRERRRRWPALAPGGVLVDMTTSRPALAVEIAARRRRRAASPRSTRRCRAATSARGTARSRSWWAATPTRSRGAARCSTDWAARSCTRAPAGRGAAHQAHQPDRSSPANMVGVCEALLYAHAGRARRRAVLASVSGGAAASWALSNLAPRIVAGDFAPGFFVDHFVKDMAIALDEAARLQPRAARARARAPARRSRSRRRATGATARSRSSSRWRRCRPRG